MQNRHNQQPWSGQHRNQRPEDLPYSNDLNRDNYSEYGGTPGYGSGNQGFGYSDAPEYDNRETYGRIPGASHGQGAYAARFNYGQPQQPFQQEHRNHDRQWQQQGNRPYGQGMDRHYRNLAEGERSQFTGRGYEMYETYESGSHPRRNEDTGRYREERDLGRYGNSPSGYASPNERENERMEHPDYRWRDTRDTWGHDREPDWRRW